MAGQHQGFFADYNPAELDQPVTLTLTHRDLLLIRTALGVSLDETSRHDHIFNDIHALLAKLPRAPERWSNTVGAAAPDKRLEHPTR